MRYPEGVPGYSGAMRAFRFGAVVAMLLAAALVVACGGDARPSADAPQSTEQADHNADDITFARNMVAHLGQGVQMAQMVLTNTSNQDITDLAKRITTTQIGEIQAFRAWLVQWPDAQGNDSGHDAAGHGTTMPGMVDARTMDRLQSLKDADFDRLWLTLMIDHHRGAIAMCRDELAHGKNPDVIYLARTIISEQEAEIDQMKQMLGG